MGFKVVPTVFPRTGIKLPPRTTQHSPLVVLRGIEGSSPSYAQNPLRQAINEANASTHNNSLEIVPLLPFGISNEHLTTVSIFLGSNIPYSQLSPGQAATLGLGTALVPVNEFDLENLTKLRQFIGKAIDPYLELFFNSNARIFPNQDDPVGRTFLYKPVHVYSADGLTAAQGPSALSQVLDGPNVDPTHMMIHFLLNGTTLSPTKVPYPQAYIKQWSEIKQALLGIANVAQYIPENLFDSCIPQLLGSSLVPFISTLFRDINFPVSQSNQPFERVTKFHIPVGQMFVPGLTLGTVNTMSQQLMEASVWMAANGVLPHSAMGGIHPIFYTNEEVLASLLGVTLQPQIIGHSPNVLSPNQLLNAAHIPFIPPLNASGFPTLDAVKDRAIQDLHMDDDLRVSLNRALQQLRKGSSLDRVYQLTSSSGNNVQPVLDTAIQLMYPDLSPQEALERAIHILYSGEALSPQFLGENYSDLGFRRANFN